MAIKAGPRVICKSSSCWVRSGVSGSVLQHLQPLGEMAEGFHIGRALNGVLASPLPVGHGLSAEARLGVVMRQQLGLGLGHLRKLRLQHLSNALVVLLPRALAATTDTPRPESGHA